MALCLRGCWGPGKVVLAGEKHFDRVAACRLLRWHTGWGDEEDEEDDVYGEEEQEELGDSDEDEDDAALARQLHEEMNGLRARRARSQVCVGGD